MFDKLKKLSLALAFLAGAAVGGAAFAGAATHATAAKPPTKSGKTSTKCPAPMPKPGTPKHENAEKAVTGDTAAQAQAAAVQAAGGGTAGDVTTDYFGKGYEVTVTQSDGSSREYHLDGAYNVLPFPDGPPPPGGPPPGGPSGPSGP